MSVLEDVRAYYYCYQDNVYMEHFLNLVLFYTGYIEDVMFKQSILCILAIKQLERKQQIVQYMHILNPYSKRQIKEI